MGGRRSRKIACTLLPLSLLVTGCASTPATPPAPVLPLVPTASRLIFFRPSALVSEGRIPQISINGLNTCALKNGTGFAKDVTPGSVNITATTVGGVYGTFGPSALSLTATAGQTYYVEFKPNVGAVFVPSLLVELASGDQTGAFDVSLSDPSELGKITPVGCES
jgi:hypothetical protein